MDYKRTLTETLEAFDFYQEEVEEASEEDTDRLLEDLVNEAE